MAIFKLGDRLAFLINRLGEILWIKPMLICLLSVAGVFSARLADRTRLREIVPEISVDSLDALLTIMASSMLVIATFAVASMVSSYASASETATPRTFDLVIADDVSQNAMSTFVGAFIFSIVALIAMKNSLYEEAGIFTLFLFTIAVFSAVIITFLRWVDSIARLGRIGSTIDKVESATTRAMNKRRRLTLLERETLPESDQPGIQIKSEKIGYVQHVDLESLQQCAEALDAQIWVESMPGAFTGPGTVLARVVPSGKAEPLEHAEQLADAFLIDDKRIYDEDPRFGLIVLSEIASRALSAAINDSGTAIDVIGTLVRLLDHWDNSKTETIEQETKIDRVFVPPISMADMFDDTFNALVRDGAASVAVMLRLLKGLQTLADSGSPEMREAAMHQARQAVGRSKLAMSFGADLDRVRHAAAFAFEDSNDFQT